ncbi:MAG: ABC transporter substrate-binding protein [Burkholderiaceae bacterium]|nr:ABC transporter substrate-binding protein [Burkholderiaceae bacterium]
MASDRTCLTGISSMATRQVLAHLSDRWQAVSGQQIQITSVGGVDAAKRVQLGEHFDLVFLASDALAKLQAQGHIMSGTIKALMRSDVAVAVSRGRPLPDISTEAALKSAVLSADSIGYSTGPSGTALLALFERWGILQRIQVKLMQAPPGVPVAQMVANGQVALGFQQRSELLHVPGITIVGPLPSAVQIETIFSGAIAARCADPEHQLQARAVLEYMTSSQAKAAITEQGMSPA